MRNINKNISHLKKDKKLRFELMNILTNVKRNYIKLKKHLRFILYPELESLEQAQTAFFYTIEIFIIIALSLFGTLAFINKEISLALTDLVILALILGFHYLFKKKIKNLKFIVLILILLFLLYLTYTNTHTHGSVFWINISPAVVIFFFGHKRGRYVSEYFYFIILMLHIFGFTTIFFPQNKLYFLRFSGSYFIITWIAYYFEKLRNRYIITLQKKNSALKKAHQQEIDLQKAKTVLSLSIAANHELKQPLMIMQANLEMLEMKTEKNPQNSKHLANLNNAVKRINDILDNLEKIEAEEIEYTSYIDKIEMVDLSKDNK